MDEISEESFELLLESPKGKFTRPSNNPSTCPNTREVSDEAIWTLSSAKPLSGVEQLRDNNLETYWQSDGSYPHFIDILFEKKTTLSEISFYLHFKQDESYTPQQISILAGNTHEDLVEVDSMDLNEPIGWINCRLSGPEDESGCKMPLRARLLQVCIASMHQNGRDTHIRQCKVYSPRLQQDRRDISMPAFSTLEFRQFSTIR